MTSWCRFRRRLFVERWQPFHNAPDAPGEAVAIVRENCTALWPRDEYEVEALRQIVLAESEGFAKETLYTISLNGSAVLL